MSISVQGISKKFKGRRKGEPDNQVLKDVSFEIEEGQFVCLLGPSGCGKTTTLTIVAGFQKPTEGIIEVNGNVVTKPGPDRAFMFQNYALFPWLKVGENIEYPMKKMKVPKEERKKRVQEICEVVGLTQYLDRKPATLSGGQRQRVALARAMVKQPKVFLMDEPLSNLDAKLRGQMRVEISKLHQRLETTIIYVTHDQTEAMTLGTRIVVLKDGVIMQVDSPQKLYNQPNNLFVAGFIGSPQMNFIDAQCVVEGAKAFLKFDKYQVELPEAKAKKLIDGGYAGKNVVFGIRPEDIYDSAEHLDKFATCKIDSDVTGYELLGAEVLLYFTVAGANMSARVDSDTPARYGDHIELAFDPHKIHVFDKETELTITN